MMKTKVDAGRQSCPKCFHALVPVHAVESSERRVLYHTCPGPYCEYVELPEPPAALPRSTGSSEHSKAG